MTTSEKLVIRNFLKIQIQKKQKKIVQSRPKSLLPNNSIRIE